MSNGEHEIRTPKGLRIGNRSVVDGLCRCHLLLAFLLRCRYMNFFML